MSTNSPLATPGHVPCPKAARPVGLKAAGFLALSALVVLATGCSGAQTRGHRVSEVDGGNTAGYVDRQMGDTVNSIDQSLQSLVRLERGDMGPRKTTPLGDTVAGAAGPAKSPYAVSRTADPDTRVAEEDRQARINTNRAMLDTRVRLDWDGEASGFLSALAKKVGFGFGIEGHGTEPKIHIHVKDATVQSVLTSVAAQINATADIHIDLERRCITLVYR